MITRGSWIEVEQFVNVYNRLDVKIFIRGNCLDDCDIGEEAEIKTTTGHIAKGTVVKDKLFYNNVGNLGKGCKEVLMIKKCRN